jgi:hypothetical protein
MNDSSTEAIRTIRATFGRDSGRLLGVVRAAPAHHGCVDNLAVATIADAPGVSEGRVTNLLGFCAFLSADRQGELSSAELLPDS